MKRALCVLSLAAALLTGGCAYYKIQPVAASSLKHWGEAGCTQEGYVFYQPELYFVATVPAESAVSTGQLKQNVTITPLYLPNYQKPFRVTTWNFLAKSDFTFGFENGWKLTQISDKADNAAVADAFAGQLHAMLSAAVTSKLASTNDVQPRQRVILYRPVFDSRGYIKSFDEVKVTAAP